MKKQDIKVAITATIDDEEPRQLTMDVFRALKKNSKTQPASFNCKLKIPPIAAEIRDKGRRKELYVKHYCMYCK